MKYAPLFHHEGLFFTARIYRSLRSGHIAVATWTSKKTGQAQTAMIYAPTDLVQWTQFFMRNC